jgi:thiamine-monophosphate kinase
MTVSSVGEHGLIARIRAAAGPMPPWVRVGIGDDAAVIDPPRGEVEVVTTDAQIEGVHFRQDLLSWPAIGAKALSVNISDLAAMAASPRAATLSLALPPSMPLADFDGLLEGFLHVARAARVPLVGGNLSASPGPVVIDVTLIGSARKRRLLSRAGGAAGHLLYVTGQLGAAAAALRTADPDGTAGTPSEAREPSAKAENPEDFTRTSRVLLPLARELAANRLASAAVDLSDGLADGVRQLAAASGTGATVYSSKIPVHPAATAEDALNGGEDYELLLAVPARRRRGFEAVARRHDRVTCIGELTPAASGCRLDRAGVTAALPGGFSHFGAWSGD